MIGPMSHCHCCQEISFAECWNEWYSHTFNWSPPGDRRKTRYYNLVMANCTWHLVIRTIVHLSKLSLERKGKKLNSINACRWNLLSTFESLVFHESTAISQISFRLPDYFCGCWGMSSVINVDKLAAEIAQRERKIWGHHEGQKRQIRWNAFKTQLSRLSSPPRS